MSDAGLSQILKPSEPRSWQEITELPCQLRNFRVQDVKCGCCANNHRHPHSGAPLPCDRELVYGMLARQEWRMRFC